MSNLQCTVLQCYSATVLQCYSVQCAVSCVHREIDRCNASLRFAGAITNCCNAQSPTANVCGAAQDRYAFRENMTDVIIQHLITEQKVRRSQQRASERAVPTPIQ